MGLNYDAHKTLGEQDGEIVLNDSYSLIDDRDSLDKGSDANRKDEVRRQRREKEIRELKASKAYKFISTVTTLADKYFLDALLGLVPSVGDLVSSILVCRLYTLLCLRSSLFHSHWLLSITI